MWKKSIKPLTKASYGSKEVMIYSLNSDDIAFIPIEKEGHGRAVVFKKESLSAHRSLKITTVNQDGTEGNYNSVWDDDLDVLKFKCLLKAKELGWNIDNL